MNGDGVGDLIVGAVFNEPPPPTRARPTSSSSPLGESNLSSADAKIKRAQESDLLGRAVNGLGHQRRWL